MKAIHKYAVYIVLLHIVLGALVYVYFSNRWVWIGAQLLLLASLYIGLRFFYLTERPYRHLVDTLHNLKDQDYSTTLQLSGHPALDGFFAQYNVLMERIQEERLHLEGQGRFLEELIFASPVGIIVADYDGFITDANPAAEALLGRTWQQLHGQAWQALLSTLGMQKNGDASEVIHWHGRKLTVVSAAIQHKGFKRQCLLLQDVTAEMLQSEKEAYGKVIRMMCHEVNNTTGAINSILETLREELTGAQAAAWKEVLQIAIDRNKSMVRFLENFASVIRVYAPQKQPVQLHTLLQNIIQLWQPEAARRGIAISLRTHMQPEGALLADPVQLEQALTNIVKNAMEAIGTQGEIKAEVHAGGKGLTIADNGTGLTDEAAAQIFQQPFFSTKERGQGIGLMIVREVLQKHQAQYTLKTHPDGWTRFEILFDAPGQRT